MEYETVDTIAKEDIEYYVFVESFGFGFSCESASYFADEEKEARKNYKEHIKIGNKIKVYAVNEKKGICCEMDWGK